MKYFFIICFMLFWILIWFSYYEDLNRSPQEKMVDRILAKTAKIIKEKYGIRPIGEGAAMPGGIISELMLAFSTNDLLSKEQLRWLLIECAHELVTQVEMIPEIEPFLKEPPFGIENAQIIIYNYNKEGRWLPDPEITTAEISRGILTYRTSDPDTDLLNKKFKETYNEAMDILQNQPSEKSNKEQ